jgi:hypothetical protein
VPKNRVCRLSQSRLSHSEDDSTLHMTAIKRIVSPLKDSNGNPIDNSNSDQQSAATLDYLCAIDDKPLPTFSSFDWNWVQPDEVNERSGVIAINRNILAGTLGIGW